MFFTVLARLLLHACVRCLHFMFPTKVACILISAYWYQFIMNSAKILGLFCRKNCQYSLYHSWNLNRKFGRKKGLFFAKITSSRFGPGSFQFCSPSYWRLTNPCNNITVSLFTLQKHLWLNRSSVYQKGERKERRNWSKGAVERGMQFVTQRSITKYVFITFLSI